MESYENLRLEQKDKIRKCSFWERFTKKESEILEENLDFLEERYQKQIKILHQQFKKIYCFKIPKKILSC